jgi:beta-lactamase regulating signal transducer with metallopeptidase domain
MIHPWLNHLWQSTLFATAAGFMTLAFRRNGAHVRYGLWFVASCKFLIPFSLLSALGRHFHWSGSSAPYAPLPPMLGRVAQPFSTAPGSLPIASTVPAPSAGIDPQMILLGVWACGGLAVGIYWLVRWLKIQATVRHATPMLLDKAIPVKSSPINTEPGVIGIFRPILLLPEGICERLSPEEMQTILTHEMCHVSRRDNLTAAIHMLVEALFWFHPLVWWMGLRLIVEREAACDEAVIARGGDPETYASGLL